MSKKKEFKSAEPGLLMFDPIVLVWDVLKRWFLILVVTVAVAMSAYIIRDASYKPVYTSSTTLVVTTRGSSATVYANLTTTQNLANVFTEILNSSLMRDTVLKEAGLDRFDGKVTASAIADTNLLTVQVSSSSPRDAFLILREILKNHDKVTGLVVGDAVVEVLQAPVVPRSPSNPSNAMTYMKHAAVITMAVCCVMILWLSASRDMVRSGKEARKKLNCSYLGEVPHERKYKTIQAMIRRAKTGILITDPTVSFRFVETFRKICHRIEQHMKENKVLMVVSLLENEGKSTVAANLALAMAKKHSRVLLIDCDLRKPACYKLLRVKNVELGLQDVLSGNVQPKDALITNSKSGLYMLLEKKSTRNSTNLISSENMRRVLQWARENFDLVILDMPPMFAVTDAEYAMDMADSTLLVVRQNAAAAPALNKVVETLNQGKAKLLGCVVNNVRSTFLTSGGSGQQKRNYYGGYGRYGRYGRYSTYYFNDSKEQD